MAGTYFKIPGKKRKKRRRPFCICEGYATGASIHMATGATVYIAFTSGMLQPVTEFLRKQFPHKPLVVAADNDAFGSHNDGISKALKVAQIVKNVKAIFPLFKHYKGKPTDFNDLHQREGLQEVKEQLQEATDALGLWQLYLESPCTRKYLFHLKSEQYLSDLPLLFDILKKYRVSRICAGTGTGKTTLVRDNLFQALQQEYHVINAMPTTALTDQKANGEGIIYHVVKQGSHPESVDTQLTTWASMGKFSDGFLSKSCLVIDEPHLLLEGLGFRRPTVLHLFELAEKCAKVIYLTATPHMYSRLYRVDVDLFVSKNVPKKRVTLIETSEPEKAVEILHPDPKQTKLIFERRKDDCERNAEYREECGQTAGVLHADNKFSKERRELIEENKIDPAIQYYYHSKYIIQGNDIEQHHIQHLYAKMLLDPITARQYLGRVRNADVDLSILKKGYHEKLKLSLPIPKYREALIQAATLLIENNELTSHELKLFKERHVHYRIIDETQDGFIIVPDKVEHEVYNYWQKYTRSTLERYKKEAFKYDLDVSEITPFTSEFTQEETETRKDITKKYKAKKEEAFQEELFCTLNMPDSDLQEETSQETEAKKRLRQLTKVTEDRKESFTILLNAGRSKTKFDHAVECAKVERYRRQSERGEAPKSPTIEHVQDYQDLQNTVKHYTRKETTLTQEMLAEIMQELCLTYPELHPFVSVNEKTLSRYTRKEWEFHPKKARNVFKALVACHTTKKGVKIKGTITYKTTLSEPCQRAIHEAIQRNSLTNTRYFVESKTIYGFMLKKRMSTRNLKAGVKVVDYSVDKAFADFRMFFDVSRTTIRTDKGNLQVYELKGTEPLTPYKKLCPLISDMYDEKIQKFGGVYARDPYNRFDAYACLCLQQQENDVAPAGTLERDPDAWWEPQVINY